MFLHTGQEKVHDCTRTPQRAPKIHFKCTVITHPENNSAHPVSQLKNFK